MKNKNLTLTELAKSLRRRLPWFVVPALLGLVAGYVIWRVTPPVYQAHTDVMVEGQKVPTDYVKPTVTSDLDERLKTIEQQITSRDNMERIIQEMDLYPELRRELSIDRVIDRMRRRDLAVQRRGDTFAIYFTNRDPVKAADTANRVAELFIQQNLKLRENQAQGTSSFLDTELAQTKAKLEQQEARIAYFKQMHMGQLPEQRDTNLQGVGQLQTKLEINMDAIDKAETRKLLLQSQIAEMRQQAEQQARQPAVLLPSAPNAPSRLDQLRAQLTEMRARYTDRHPDIIQLKEEIAQLERIEREAASAPPRVAEEIPRETFRIDPELRAQLEATEYEIRSLHAERARILDDINSYQARLESIPRVEQELLSLSRDYDNIKRAYESLLDKQGQARLAQNLEKTRQSEQFTILNKAYPPSEPYAPKQPLMLAMGLAAGCLVGFLLVLLRDRTDATYADAEGLQQAFPGVRVLATIPMFSGRMAGASASVSRFSRRS
jgi:polysaccharide chain length determinant protein (PEP-CTERM system associated)